MKVSAILKGPKDQYNRTRVYIRVNDKFKRKFYPTNIKAVSLDLLTKIEKDVIKTLILKHETGYSKLKKDPVKFSIYVLDCIRTWQRSKKPSTLKQIYSELTKFNQFQNPFISKITHETLSEYLQYCYSLGNSTNTAWKSFKFLRMILRKAYREKLIEENPFDLFEMPKYKDPPRSYLSKSQVEQIHKFLKDSPKEVKFAGTWFLISCYTGLRFSDLQSFNKKKIKDGRLVIYTAKTGEIVSLPIKDKLKSLLEKVNYKPIPYTNTHYNRYLRLIGTGIGEKITAHIGRHTCAVMLADAGVSIEVVGKILGHQSLKSTAVYFKITNKRIDDELGRIL